MNPPICTLLHLEASYFSTLSYFFMDGWMDGITFSNQI